MKYDAVLLITDDLESANMLAHGLVMRGVQVDIVAINSHLHYADELARYTLVIVDTDRTDGVVLCRQLRDDYKNPLIFLTYERDERYHLLVYEAGVDDCIQKPIGNSLFLAKIDIWFRTARRYGPTCRTQIEGFHLDPTKRNLRLPDGKNVPLTSLEIRLIELFFHNPNLILEADTIIRHVWDDYSAGDSVLLKNLIYRIRRKIEQVPSTPHFIQTAFRGYVFRPDSVNGDK